MTKEEKELLLKYLCAALPYGVFVSCAEGTVMGVHWNKVKLDASLLFEFQDNDALSNVKPYLRPMDSMTEEEVNEYNQCWEKDRDDIMIIGKHFEEMYKSKKFTLYMHPVVPMYRHILWLLKNHFDFMGLIPKGLAIEVTKENNPYERID